MRNSYFSRLISFVLVVAMLVNILPLHTFAANESNTNNSVQAGIPEPVTIVGEEVALRSEAEKHFRLSDGSYIAVSYGMPVHFRDEAGNWQDIDNRPLLAADADGVSSYQISNADKSTSFPSVLTDGTLFSTAVGDVSVSMQLLDTVQALERCGELNISANATAELVPSDGAQDFQVYSRSAAAVIETSENAVAISQDTSGWQPDDVMPENLGASIVYENVFPGVDLRYEAYSYNIKEEIIIHEAQNSYRYDFLLTLNGLNPRLNEDGSVALFNENNTVIYEIPAPYMYDGTGSFCTDVEYALQEVEDGVILTVVADSEWINDASREFPVTIDPTLNLKVYTTNNGEDLSLYIAAVREAYPDLSTQGAEQVYFGYAIQAREARGYIYVKNLPDLPIGATVTHASLDMYMIHFSSGGLSKFPLGLYEVSSGPADGQTYEDWIRHMTWNTKADYLADNIIDYHMLSSSTVAQNFGPVSWDMTELVKKWYIEGTQNRTVALSLTSDGYSPTSCATATFNTCGSSYAPMLVVAYRSNLGIEPYYTYTTLGAGAAGTAYIADATGQLRVAQALLGYASTVNPYTLSAVYNSDYFASGAAADYQPMADLGLNMSMGAGWRLSCVEKIESEIISNTTYLKYYDGDGTIHYFIPYNNAYYDEDGLGLKIVSKGSNAYEMTDDHGNKWTFTNGFLTSFSDETGNQIIFTYESNQLKAIAQKNAGCGQITIASFTYSGSTLSTATDAAGNVYSFSYDSGKLTSIKQNNTTIAQYGYASADGSETNYRLTQMVDAESGYQLQFIYNSAGKVSRFQETGRIVTGRTVDISYPNYSQTVYRDYGLNQTSAGDDILTYYLFDYAGRTANAYTTDMQDNVLGASSAVYSGCGSTDKDNNRTMRTASIGVAAQQLLQNPSVESASVSPWSLSGGMTTSSQAHTGLKGFAGSNGAAAAYNAGDLAAGKTYTFSGYVKIPTAGTSVTLEVRNSSNTLLASDSVSYVTTSQIQNPWVRASVTFTAGTAGTYQLIVKASGAATVYADDFQLELAEAPSTFNLVEDSSFRYGTSRWILGTGARFGISSDTLHPHTLGISGDPNSTATNAYQDIPINLSSKETYVLSGWAKADAAPDTLNTAADPAQDLNKQFGLRAVITYTDNSTEYHYVPFNPELTGWQFTSCAIVPDPKDENGNPVEKTVASIRVICAYESNINTAHFDNISLVREIAQTMKYDADGNLVSVNSTGLKEDENTYANGNLIRTVTGGQGTFEYTYDTTYKHRLTSVTNGLITQSMSHDGVGNVHQTTLKPAEGDTPYMQTSATYTNSGNLLSSVTDAAGSTVTYGYIDYTNDAGTTLTSAASSRMWGLPTSVTAPSGAVTRTAYDQFGRVAKTDVAELATLEYTYTEGRLDSIRRTNSQNVSQTYHFTYNTFGNTTAIKVGTRVLAQYNYYPNNGPLQTQTYGNGHTVNYTYDNLGRTKTVTHAGGRTLTYAYTGDGQLYSVTETKPNSDPVVYLYQYDTLGRLMSSEKRVNGASVLRSYQSFNDCNQIVLSGWQISENTFSQTYTYNAEDGSIATVTLPNGATLTYTYDSLRRVSSIHNGIFNQTYTYEAGDAANQTTPRLTKIGYPSLKSAMNYTYSYDDSGNIVSMAFGSRTNTYVYDINGQLVRENNDRDQYTRTWTYDEAGNITSRSTYAYTTATNPGTATETVTYGYTDTNWRDLLTQYDGCDIYYDNIGNPVQIKDGDTVVATYTWAEGRQLVSMTENGATTTYTYDANGMRTGRTYTKGSTTNTYQYFYSGDKLVRLIRNGVTVDFSYNGNIPATMTFNGNTYYYLTNVQGDIIGLTDSTGKIVMGYLYEAYGYPSALNEDPSLSSTILLLNPFMYRGYVFDLETKLYYLQSRYYDPEMGRFINADSLVSTGQGILGYNMFAYCNNNPVNFDDPTGNLTRGQIHNLVLDQIIEEKRQEGRSTLRRRKTCIYYNCVDAWGGWGFCDLYDTDTGEVWELKRSTCDKADAQIQLGKYVNGALKHNKALPLQTGGRLIPAGIKRSFTYTDKSGTYDITYWDDGDGILWYDYVYRPSDRQKQINAALMLGTTVVACTVVGTVFVCSGGAVAVGTSTIIPFVVPVIEQISNAA